MLYEFATAPRPRLGVRIDVETMAPGVVSLSAAEDHRVRIHAGAPVGGECSGHRFVYERGDVDLVPAGMSDSWYEDDAARAIVLSLSPAFLRRAAEEMGRSADQVTLHPRHQFRDPRIEHVAWALEAERASGYENGVLYAESLGLALALHLLGGYETRERQRRGLSRPQLHRVTRYIEEHIDQDLSLAAIARVAGVSASHLRTLFRRSTGLPVHEYVVQRRVERAKALLIQGHLPQSEIALQAGFAHQSHMARCMRRILGVTPKALSRA